MAIRVQLDRVLVERRMSLTELADRVGVSRMTVSNAFSRPDQLSAELRASILATIAAVDYARIDAPLEEPALTP